MKGRKGGMDNPSARTWTKLQVLPFIDHVLCARQHAKDFTHMASPNPKHPRRIITVPILRAMKLGLGEVTRKAGQARVQSQTCLPSKLTGWTGKIKGQEHSCLEMR